MFWQMQVNSHEISTFLRWNVMKSRLLSHKHLVKISISKIIEGWRHNCSRLFSWYLASDRVSNSRLWSGFIQPVQMFKSVQQEVKKNSRSKNMNFTRHSLAAKWFRVPALEVVDLLAISVSLPEFFAYELQRAVIIQRKVISARQYFRQENRDIFRKPLSHCRCQLLTNFGFFIFEKDKQDLI